MDIQDIFKQFSSAAEIQAYASSQYHTIIELTKRINEQEKEISHLKNLLDGMVTRPGLIDIFAELSDEECISLTQLKLLRNNSLERELTAEESKKVDLYTKVLYAAKEHHKKRTQVADGTSVKDLLSIVKNDG